MAGRGWQMGEADQKDNPQDCAALLRWAFNIHLFSLFRFTKRINGQARQRTIKKSLRQYTSTKYLLPTAYIHIYVISGMVILGEE